MRSAWVVVGWMLCGAAAAAAEVPRNEHPRPDFRRDQWLNLNGPWQFCFDADDQGVEQRWHSTGAEAAARFDRQIIVPFCWESRLSGIADTSGQTTGWYRRTVRVPEEFAGRRVWLCFGAVDWEARVWIDGHEVGRHEGGYSPFALDITDLAPPGKDVALVVRALDATDPELPLGKQGKPWFTPTSGIWQTVYLESRPPRYIESLRLVPACRDGRWSLEVEVEAAGPDGAAEIEIASAGEDIGKENAQLTLREGRGQASASLEIASPRTWSPEDPHLYDLDVTLTGPDGQADTVHTYFGLRTVAQGRYGDLPYGMILLNGKPVYLRGAIDASFNPEGIYTAPSDEFIRRDLELARAAGFNLLRIHLKADEPRRLYWADRTGMLLIEDMPSSRATSERGRRAWQATMRATIRRDRNHPALIGWCLFNEGWGLGDEYLRDRGAQSWVLEQCGEVKQSLDPTRLVDDQVAAPGAHVKTDLLSWRFRPQDYREARNELDEVVACSKSVAPFYCVPGVADGGLPLVSLDYGGLPVRGAEGEVPWDFRCLTTQLRRQEKVQGCVYAGLTDVEWDRAGVIHYDRSPKELGYDAFVPGMQPANLLGPDFVGFDAPPVLQLEPDERFTLPVFVSHYSPRERAPRLTWRIVGIDDLGRPVATAPAELPVVWEPNRVTFQKLLQVTAPRGRPLVGALTLELIGQRQERVAANYVNLVVRSRPPAEGKPEAAGRPARLEVLGPRLVALRFEPAEFAAFRTDRASWDWLERRGKLTSPGSCEVEYHVELPEFVRRALPAQVMLLAELATRADRGPDGALSSPGQQAGKASVHLLGRRLWDLDLPGDPADARGVLSYLARHESGSFGFLVRQKADLTDELELRERMASEPFLKLVVRTEDGRGLSIYGADAGRYPIDPTLLVETARDLGQPEGSTWNGPVTVDGLLDRVRLVQGIATSDQGGHVWRISRVRPEGDWTAATFDDSAWEEARPNVPREHGGAPWPSPDVWLRTEVELPRRPLGIALRYVHDEDVEVYVNGSLLCELAGHTTAYRQRVLAPSEAEMFRPGRNVIAVRARQTRGGVGADVGLTWITVADVGNRSRAGREGENRIFSGGRADSGGSAGGAAKNRDNPL